MKKLLIMRHAEAGSPRAGETDFDRPLSSAGKEDALQMGAHLGVQTSMAPALILSSPSRRTQMTAERIFESLTRQSVKLCFRETFYLATAARLVEELAELADEESTETGIELDCVLLVGHNPGVCDLVHLLTGAYCDMPPATVATIELPIRSWGEIEQLRSGTGQLVSACHPGAYSSDSA